MLIYAIFLKWNAHFAIVLNGPFQLGKFFLHFRLIYAINSKHMLSKICLWLDSSPGPLLLEVTTASINNVGSGCGAVGRADAFDTRGPTFESSHRQLLLNIYLLWTVCRKDEK